MADHQNDPKGAAGEAAPKFVRDREESAEAVLSNLVSLVDCVSWLLIAEMKRVETDDGERYQMPVHVGDQAAAILVMGRDAGLAFLNGGAS